MQKFDVAGADARHLWHPYTQHAVGDPPIEITRAEGAYIYDADGRPILDAISSWWVTLHGHAEPTIAAAIAEQARTLEQVIFAGFTHEPAARLATELVKRAPAGLDRVFFSDDGSTAVEVAVKMALQYWQNRGEDRRVIVALEHAYHGDTFGAMSVSARGLFTDPFKHQMFDVVHLPHPSDFQRLVLERGKDIAALIVEPMVQGAGGMLMWPAESLAALRQISESAGIPLIADEVMTGFGRTGPLFACEHADISPDLMCLSKGITGGFLPLGATLARGSIFDAFWSDDRRKTLFHGHSFTANPITCAASLASLALLDDACAARRTAIKTSHRKAAERFARIKALKNIRVLGTILAADFLADDSGYLSGVGPALRAFALQRGVLLRPLGDTVYILPPYCVTDNDLTKVYDVIAEFAESR